jgi:hypothetical protein
MSLINLNGSATVVAMMVRIRKHPEDLQAADEIYRSFLLDATM